MQRHIFYELAEHDGKARQLSLMRSDDPLMCLAAMLLKLRRPSSIAISNKVPQSQRTITIERSNEFSEVAAYIDMKASLSIRGSEETPLTLLLSTGLAHEPIRNGMWTTESREPGFPAYRAILERMRRRMHRWCEGSLEAALILTAFAAQDTDHGFWQDRDTEEGG